MRATDKPLPYYRWFWQDWRANRTVSRMTYIERGLYRELLDECWAEGSVPDSMDAMAEICGCPVDVMASAWQVLSKCFRLIDGRWHNDKLDSVRTEKDAERVKRQSAGRLGGIRKSLNAIESVASAKQVLDVASVCHIEEKRREENKTPLTPLSGGNPVGQKPKRKARAKSEALHLSDWLSACKESGRKPIPDDDPIRQWADDAGIPPDYMALAWRVFCRDWKTKKPQKDWPATFRDAVKRNWLKLWYPDEHGGYALTVAGKQEQRAVGQSDGT